MGDADELEEYEEVENLDELDAAEEQKASEARQLKERRDQGSSREASDSGAKPADGYDVEAQKEIDSRSIYVGQVDYSVDSKSIAEFFSSCGTVNRVTIPGNKDKHPKGYAYVEFMEPEAVENALKLDNAEIAGRMIQVARKRTNEAGFSRGRGGRGRALRGRGRGRSPWGMMPMMPMPYPFDPFMCESRPMCATEVPPPALNIALPYRSPGGYSPYARFSPTRGRGRGGRGRMPGRGRVGEQEADA